MRWWVYCYCGSILLLLLSWPFAMFAESKRRTARDFHTYRLWSEATDFFYAAFFCGMGGFFLTSALLFAFEVWSKA